MSKDTFCWHFSHLQRGLLTLCSKMTSFYVIGVFRRSLTLTKSLFMPPETTFRIIFHREQILTMKIFSLPPNQKFLSLYLKVESKFCYSLQIFGNAYPATCFIIEHQAWLTIFYKLLRKCIR